MIGLWVTIRNLLATRPTKETAIMLAVLAASLVLQLIAAAHAGRQIDIID